MPLSSCHKKPFLQSILQSGTRYWFKMRETIRSKYSSNETEEEKNMIFNLNAQHWIEFSIINIQ